ncbi:four-carbon acid sugar kinase family protein [Stackebrandtia soli]|uniref:four-carbon acid sugar kinase family protein n=1 Tax=Stackebrandtia soli TaxID=1892856 RepID=UPI0039E8BE95
MTAFGFVADDLTGASDVLAQAHLGGLEAVLVLHPRRGLPNADVVGVAGPARSLSGAALDAAIREGIAPFREREVQVLLYKVCSTFDSSPTVGSIGRAIELLHEAFPAHGPIPVAPAQPDFGRYTAFSQHFGVYEQHTYRLDRHPVMSRHPSTPMTEADLRLILSAQLDSGDVPNSIHLPSFGDGSFRSRWRESRQRTESAFVVDAVENAHLDQIAAALLETRPDVGPTIVVGSGGIMAALARTMKRTVPTPSGVDRASGPVLAVSASASAATGNQITDAITRGWIDIPIDGAALNEDDAFDELLDRITGELADGHDVIAHTARGPEDPRLVPDVGLSAAHIGARIGRIAATTAERRLTRDIAICGGDTSSHALLAADVNELRVISQFVTAGPVCATDPDSALADCRVLLKGGQVGPVDVLHRFAGR